MRNSFWSGLACICLCQSLIAGSGGFTKGREVAPLSPEFKAGDYIWKPQVSPVGPVVIVVSIPKQMMFVYRNGVRIGRSSISTGRKENPTPTGVFTIKQKKVDHESSIYKGAKMPYMQRLTWDGIAMHGGQLPGYPASRGCVRLPVDFAAKLYQVTTNDTTVIVTDQKNAPGQTAKPGLLFSGTTGNAQQGPLPSKGFQWEPGSSGTGPVSIVFSFPDGIVYVYRNGVEIGRCTFSLDKNVRISGSHVYSALDKVDRNGRRDWLAVTSIGGAAPPNLKALTRNLSIPAEFLGSVRSIITPGTTLLLTDLAVSGQASKEEEVPILTTEAN